MQEIVSETRNQELTDQINRKFNLHLKIPNNLLDNQEHLNNNDIINNNEEASGNSVSWSDIGWKILDFIYVVLLFIGVALLCILFILLTIITLGGIFWVPWLFKKIFGCCFDFGGGDISADKNKNLGSSQDLIPDQSSSLEENLGK